MTHHQDVAAMRSIFLRCEGAPQQHARAEQAEVSFRDMNPMQLLGNSSGQVEPFAAEVIRCHVPEDAGLLLPHVELGCGSAWTLPLRRRIQELNDPVGFGVSERLEENRVDDGEDCGIGPDTESQGGDHRKGEARILCKHAQGMPNVRQQVGQTAPPWSFGHPCDYSGKANPQLSRLRNTNGNEETAPGKGSVSLKDLRSRL